MACGSGAPPATAGSEERRSSSESSLAASSLASAKATRASASATVSARTLALDRELRTLSTDGALPDTAGRAACSRFGDGSTRSTGLWVELTTV